MILDPVARMVRRVATARPTAELGQHISVIASGAIDAMTVESMPAYTDFLLAVAATRAGTA